MCVSADGRVGGGVYISKLLPIKRDRSHLGRTANLGPHLRQGSVKGAVHDNPVHDRLWHGLLEYTGLNLRRQQLEPRKKGAVPILGVDIINGCDDHTRAISVFIGLGSSITALFGCRCRWVARIVRLLSVVFGSGKDGEHSSFHTQAQAISLVRRSVNSASVRHVNSANEMRYSI